MGKVTETCWSITAPDGATIYGVLNQGKTPSKRAIFMVHGLTGHMYEYQFKYTADKLAQDYDVYRFNLYDWNTNARKLQDCTVAVHAADLTTVLAQFAGAYDQVFVVGHSYGGPTVATANPASITAASLWDPTFDATGLQQEFVQDIITDDRFYTLQGECTYLIGQAMYEEAGRLGQAACQQLAENFNAPVQVVHASEGVYVQRPDSYHTYCSHQTDYVVIDGTEHCFYENDSADRLVQETKRWFDQF